MCGSRYSVHRLMDSKSVSGEVALSAGVGEGPGTTPGKGCLNQRIIITSNEASVTVTSVHF